MAKKKYYLRGLSANSWVNLGTMSIKEVKEFKQDFPSLAKRLTLHRPRKKKFQ